MAYTDTWPHTPGWQRSGRVTWGLQRALGQWYRMRSCPPRPPWVTQQNLERVPRGCVQDAAASTKASPRGAVRGPGFDWIILPASFKSSFSNANSKASNRQDNTATEKNRARPASAMMTIRAGLTGPCARHCAGGCVQVTSSCRE